MRPMKRAVHIDFHTMPRITDFGTRFDAAELAQTLADANVDYVNVFARCNIGFSYYPTRLGTPYPHMTGDLLGDTIKECHKRDIGVTAYINAGLNHQLLTERMDFMRVDGKGRVYEENPVYNHYFRALCFNTGYRDYLKQEVMEVLEYKPDGIFLDCMIPRSCYCPKCVKLMTEKGIDITDDKAVFAFAVDTLLGVFDEMSKLVPSDIRFYINSFPYEGTAPYCSHLELECLPTYRWGYDFVAAQAPYHRNNAGGKDLVYMTGRMVTCWGDFSGSKPDAALENDVYDALLYGFYPSVGDNMHPRDGLDKKLYRQVGKMYSFVKSLEPYTDNTKPAVEAAILRNKVTAENVLTPVTTADKGVARMMSELKLSYDVVNEDMELSHYKLLILPDEIKITDKLAEKLNSFKGAVLSTGCSIRKDCIWDYVDEFTPDTNDEGFYTFEGEVYGQKYCGIKMKSKYSVSDYVEPYFNKIFDGFHGYFYVPPKDPAGYSAIARKGNRVHLCFDIFKAYMEFGALFHRELIAHFINELLPERILMADSLPSTSRASLRLGDGYAILHVKVTYPEHWGNRGIIDEHNVLPAGRQLSVKGKYQKATVLPEMKELSCVYADGYTTVTLPEITGYTAIMLK